jgi:hypothetical protein
LIPRQSADTETSPNHPNYWSLTENPYYHILQGIIGLLELLELVWSMIIEKCLFLTLKVLVFREILINDNWEMPFLDFESFSLSWNIRILWNLSWWTKVKAISFLDFESLSLSWNRILWNLSWWTKVKPILILRSYMRL